MTLALCALCSDKPTKGVQLPAVLEPGPFLVPRGGCVPFSKWWCLLLMGPPAGVGFWGGGGGKSELVVLRGRAVFPAAPFFP